MYTMRLARVPDARAVAEMSRDLIEHGLGWRWTTGRVLRCIRDAETNVLVARAGARLAGFAIMSYREDSAHLLLCAVAPDHRRRGIGRALWAWLYVTAEVAGLRRVHLEVRAGSGAARAFYRQLGFVEDDTVPGYYGGVEAAVRMHLELGRIAASGQQ
ncbi:MAG: GNAT family N-acetyltransferase [Gammaproteobacteria bacterium]